MALATQTGIPGPQGPQGEPGAAGPTLWSLITDKPSTFPPTSHDADHTNLHAPGSDNQDLSGLVVKVTGSSLVTDTEVSKLAGVAAGAQANADITKVEIEAKLTGELSSHSHAGGSHTQGTDQGLDTGGTNEVTAAQTKTGYSHSQAAHAPTDAETNVNADWNAGNGDAQILNKPAILALGELSTDAYRGDRGKIGYDHSQIAHLNFSGLAKITVGTVEPVTPGAGDLWVDTN